MKGKERPIYFFIILLIILSAIVEGAIICLKNRYLLGLLMWIPAIVAFITKWKYYRGEKQFFHFHKCKLRYILFAVILPLLYIGVPYVVYWIINLGSVKQLSISQMICTSVIGIVIGMQTSLGEEIGWRGFLVPQLLKHMSLIKTLIISSLIWGVWHLPILVSGLYMPGTPVWFQVPMFIIDVLGAGFIIGLLTIRSKSIWPAVVMHSAHNTFDQMVFGPITDGSNKMYFVSETGIFTVVGIILLAILLYFIFQMKREEKVT